MPVDIKVPEIGESITEGTISQWLKKDGDVVDADEPIFELETEKATTPVPAPAAGRLVIKVKEGETVGVGQVLGHIEEGAGEPKGEKAGKKPPPPEEGEEEDDRAEEESAEADEQGALLSPAARHLAEEAGIEISQLTGSGRDGRILKEDVLAYLEKMPKEKGKKPSEQREPAREKTEETDRKPATRQSVAEISPQTPRVIGKERETRQRMSSIRQRIAERLVAAKQTAAILTTFNEVDMSAVLGIRSKYKEAFQKKHEVGLGLMSFFVKACVEALQAFPVVNARLDGSDIVYHNYCSIGVAVSTEKGLMVPVLHDAQDMSLADIEKRIMELAEKARKGSIAVQDLQGGTFTITNGGVFGSMLSTPILNPPQSGILGMHTIQKRPVAVGEEVVIRPMMYLALSYDHRLIDGREAVSFLVRVKECIESPERMLLGI